MYLRFIIVFQVCLREREREGGRGGVWNEEGGVYVAPLPPHPKHIAALKFTEPRSFKR